MKRGCRRPLWDSSNGTRLRRAQTPLEKPGLVEMEEAGFGLAGLGRSYAFALVRGEAGEGGAAGAGRAFPWWLAGLLKEERGTST